MKWKSILWVFLLIAFLAIPSSVYAQGWFRSSDADGVSTDTTNFDNNLSSSDSTVQAALETLDELAGGSGDSISVAGSAATNANFLEGLAIDLSLNTTPSPDEITIAFDPTEITGNRTWSAGGSASVAWTFDLSGTDPVLTAVSGGFDVTGDFDVSSTIEAGSGNITLTNATGNIDGEVIADDTIDDDSIDFSDVTGADLTLTDAGAITASGLITGNAGLKAANGATSAGFVDIFEDTDDGSNKTRIQVVPMAADVTYLLPPDDGDAGEQLQTNGSGVLTWEAAGSFDSTAVDATTWSDGANASNQWTFDVSGTDHTMTAGDGVMTFGDSVTVTDVLSAPTLTLTGTGTINGLDAVDSTGEDTIEALIFDNDAQDITGVWEVQDDVNFQFGNDADWLIQYDEGVDNQLLFMTANTAAIATMDPMFEILVDTGAAGMTANQQVFGIGVGSQASNTAIFTVDEDGDGVFAGDLTVTGGDFVFGTTNILSGGDTTSLNEIDAIDSVTETTLESAIDIAGDVSGTGLGSVTIGADKVQASHLKAVNTEADEDIVTYESTTGDFEFHTPSELITAGDYIDWSGTTLNVIAGSTTAVGAVEVADATEVNAGTDAARVISPDALAGSNFGERPVELVVFDFATNVATGDGKYYFVIPSSLDGMNLIECRADVITAGTTNSTTIQIHNLTQTADMLSALLEVETGETSSATSDPGPTIDTNNDDVAGGDRIRIDVDTVSTTAPKGLIITLIFGLP